MTDVDKLDTRARTLRQLPRIHSMRIDDRKALKPIAWFQWDEIEKGHRQVALLAELGGDRVVIPVVKLWTDSFTKKGHQCFWNGELIPFVLVK